jgi:hypothetical protein
VQPGEGGGDCQTVATRGRQVQQVRVVAVVQRLRGDRGAAVMQVHVGE